MKLSLPHVTLFCLDCVDAERIIPVLEHCKSLCDFGAVKFLTSLETDYPHEKIEPITGKTQADGLIAYSKFLVHRMHEYIPTSHVLTVQHDGWVLNPSAWRAEWMGCDYLAPLFIQYPKVGSGGFSFRSKRLMQVVDELSHDLVKRRGGQYGGYSFEDGMICLMLRMELETRGFRFATVPESVQFAYGGLWDYYNEKPFGYHGFYALDRLIGGTGKEIPRSPDLNFRPYKAPKT